MKTRSVITSLVALGVAATLAQPADVAAQVEVEASVAASIVDRMPENPTTTFPADVGTVYAWSRVTGAAATTLQHVWIHDGQEHPVSLEIGGSPWRTWSSKEIPAEWSGDWTVEIRDATGTVLETLSFTVGS
jgi:hypothetical protein